MKYFFLSLALLAAQASSAAGPVKVAIIDTGLDLKDPRFSSLLCRNESHDFTGRGLRDVMGHGTHVAGLIKRYAGTSGYCLIILKYYIEADSGAVNQTRLRKAFKYAVTHNANIVNYSGGGGDASPEERAVLRGAKGTLFVVAAGNESKDMDLPGNEYYPAAYPLANVIAVGALRECSDGALTCCARAASSNYGSRVQAWEVGENVYSTLPCKWVNGYQKCDGFFSGTSMATAIHTGKILGKKVGYAAKTF